MGESWLTWDRPCSVWVGTTKPNLTDALLASEWGVVRVSVDRCFRVVVAMETSTESLILAQDERWRRA